MRPAASLDVQLRDDGGFALRPYQQAAVDAFWADGRVDGGCGVVVLPCGAGKTVVGIGGDGREWGRTPWC